MVRKIGKKWLKSFSGGAESPDTSITRFAMFQCMVGSTKLNTKVLVRSYLLRINHVNLACPNASHIANRFLMYVNGNTLVWSGRAAVTVLSKRINQYDSIAIKSFRKSGIIL